MVAHGEGALDAAGLKMFRQKFIHIASGLQQESLKESAMLMES